MIFIITTISFWAGYFTKVIFYKLKEYYDTKEKS